MMKFEKEQLDKVYVVTSGCYSDYGIERVFDSLDKAEKFCSSHNNFAWGEKHIEVYKLNGGMCDEDLYIAKVDADGKVLSKERNGEVSLFSSYSISDKVIYCVKGASHKNYDHAIKSARDNLAKLKYKLSTNHS